MVVATVPAELSHGASGLAIIIGYKNRANEFKITGTSEVLMKRKVTNINLSNIFSLFDVLRSSLSL